MTHFPHHSRLRAPVLAAVTPVSVRPALKRDILWDQPVFQAPTLPSPRVVLEPLPFTAQRLTLRRARA